MTSTSSEQHHQLLLSPIVAGIIGLIFSIIIWLISSWRLLFHLSGCYLRHPPRFWLAPRRLFHSLLWIASSVEAIAYADLARIIQFPKENTRVSSEKIGHILLDLLGRAMFEYSAFVLVTMLLWYRTASEARSVMTTTNFVSSMTSGSTSGSNTPNNNTTTNNIFNTNRTNKILDTIPYVLITTTLVLIGTSIWETHDLLLNSKNDDIHFSTYERTSGIHKFHMFVESISWLIHSIIVIICIVLTTKSIHLQLQTFPQSNILFRTALVSKPLVPMAVCGICYLIRSLWLLVRLVRLAIYGRNPNETEIIFFDTAYWIGFVWLPTWIPTIMVLYSARKRDTPPPPVSASESSASLEGSRGPSQEPLIMTPVPPAEAFTNFRRISNMGMGGGGLSDNDADLLTPFTIPFNIDHSNGNGSSHVGSGNNTVQLNNNDHLESNSVVSFNSPKVTVVNNSNSNHSSNNNNEV